MRLADAGEQETAFVRRRVSREELDLGDAHTAAALATLTDSRLVTADERTLEVAHEALLREWPRLRDWLEDDIQGRRLHHHLRAAAKEWETRGRDRGELFRGARLASALDWAADHDAELNDVEHAFPDERTLIAAIALPSRPSTRISASTRAPASRSVTAGTSAPAL
jgi:hypothetical protein